MFLFNSHAYRMNHFTTITNPIILSSRMLMCTCVVRTVMVGYEAYPGVDINWVYYGSSGHVFDPRTVLDTHPVRSYHLHSL
jgi:hypothetical protein